MKPGRRPLRHPGWPPLAWNFPTVIVYFCVQPIYLLLRSRDQKSVVERDEPGASNALYSVGRNRCTGLRSEEHTSELQSHLNIVSRLLLEKKKHETSTSLATAP